jgi:hypothetical protein
MRRDELRRVAAPDLDGHARSSGYIHVRQIFGSDIIGCCAIGLGSVNRGGVTLKTS